jgi:hypothetical protein
MERPMLKPILLAGLLTLSAATAGAAEQVPARFIPLQLIIGGAWDGEPTITYPAGRFAEGFAHGSVWVGPTQWVHPKTGKTLTVYERSRGGRNAADQIFAVRDDHAAIGRVADSRFGISACDGEGKYPLGLWHQGETRRFDDTCWHGDKPTAQFTTITIRELDYTCGASEHCLEEEWILRNRDGEGELDHRIYIFAPGRGMVEESQVR